MVCSKPEQSVVNTGLGGHLAVGGFMPEPVTPLERSCVLSAGPKQETVNDFWRMVWEQKSAIIVMLTNLKERKEVKICFGFLWGVSSRASGQSLF